MLNSPTLLAWRMAGCLLVDILYYTVAGCLNRGIAVGGGGPYRSDQGRSALNLDCVYGQATMERHGWSKDC
jgi:hypothetical protein